MLRGDAAAGKRALRRLEVQETASSTSVSHFLINQMKDAGFSRSQCDRPSGVAERGYIDPVQLLPYQKKLLRNASC